MDRRQASAIAALVLAASGVALALVVVVEGFPVGLALPASLVVAVAATVYAARRRGVWRSGGFMVALLAVVGAVVGTIAEGRPLEHFVLVIVVVLALAAARDAFAVRARLPPAPVPSRPVVFLNPRSGGGKVERFHLVAEARARGIEPIELRPGDDLAALVRDAVHRGAGALAMAGGDGSQAVVAGIAAEVGLPYACVPAGTRNHFALDLGVDRQDVVGALDAFVDGGEYRVDLGDVNGRVFVNNVSLGLYGEAVQRGGYRDAKLKTLLDTVPNVLGPDGEPPRVRWRGPDGREHASAAAILVSNNTYRLRPGVGAGTRPRLDSGLLGIVVIDAPPPAQTGPGGSPLRQWSAQTFEVEAAEPVPAGIDGEAVVLVPPLRFSIRRAVLRVRISRRHSGASPSAAVPEDVRQGIRSLTRIALGRGAPERAAEGPRSPPDKAWEVRGPGCPASRTAAGR